MEIHNRERDCIEDLLVTIGFNIGASILLLIAFSILRCCQKPESQESARPFLPLHRHYSESVELLSLTTNRLTGKTLKKLSKLVAWETSRKSSIFGWIYTLATISDIDIVIRCHKDGFLYLLFLKYLYNYFFIISLCSCGILLPIFLSNTNSNFDHLSTYTISNIKEEKWKLWCILLFTELYSILALVMLYIFNHRIKSMALAEV